MSDAVEPEPTAYASFNEFFTRALRAGTRPVDADPRAIVSPVDGTVSEAGTLSADRLLQAKGHEYTLRALLAGNAAWERTFAGGSFATIYLAPYNYHRIHMPLAGELRESFYVPGKLFSVNRTTAQLVPGLFSRNERVFCGFDSGGMPWAIILVGALNVGSMATVWHGDVTPRKHREVTAVAGDRRARADALSTRARRWRRFNMGSTVILLLPPGRRRLAGDARRRTILRMGERIGTLAPVAMNPGPLNPWRPSASLAALRRRAEALHATREFFRTRNVLEVETPALVNAPVSDVNLGSARVEVPGSERRAVPAHLARIRHEAPARGGQRRHLPGLSRVSRRRTRPPAQPGIHHGRVVPAGLFARAADARSRRAGARAAAKATCRWNS